MKRPLDLLEYPKSEGTSDQEHESATCHAFAELPQLWTTRPAGASDELRVVADGGGTSAPSRRRAPSRPKPSGSTRLSGSDGRLYPWGNELADATWMNAAGTEFNRWETRHGIAASPRMYDGDDGFAGTAPVGSFPRGRTSLGANDMIGNVWEWTGDWFATYKPGEAVNPKGAPVGDRKAIRGGGFNGGATLWLNPAFRYHQLATASTPAIGFRCVSEL